MPEFPPFPSKEPFIPSYPTSPTSPSSKSAQTPLSDRVTKTSFGDKITKVTSLVLCIIEHIFSIEGSFLSPKESLSSMIELRHKSFFQYNVLPRVQNILKRLEFYSQKKNLDFQQTLQEILRVADEIDPLLNPDPSIKNCEADIILSSSLRLAALQYASPETIANMQKPPELFDTLSTMSEEHSSIIDAHQGGAPVLQKAYKGGINFFHSGDESTAEIIRMIQNAETFVTLEMFIYTQGSDQARQIHDALIARAQDTTKPPLKVFFLLNNASDKIAKQLCRTFDSPASLAEAAWEPTAVRAQEEDGGSTPPPDDIENIRLKSLVEQLKSEEIEFTVATYEQTGRSLNHRKLIVADSGDDGLVQVLMPGHNIKGQHTTKVLADGTRLRPLEDIAVRYSGPEAYKTALSTLKYFERSGAIQYSTLESPSNETLLTPLQKTIEATTTKAPPPETETTDILFCSQKVQKGLTTKSIMSPVRTGLLTMFRNASEKIKIMCPNFQDEEVILELIYALKRGVEVQILLSEGCQKDNAKFGGATNEMAIFQLQELAKRFGCEDKLKVKYAKNEDGAPPYDWNPGAIHAKLYIADGYTMGGSYNLDNQSKVSAEDALFYKSEDCPDAEQYFDAFFDRSSTTLSYPDKLKKSDYNFKSYVSNIMRIARFSLIERRLGSTTLTQAQKQSKETDKKITRAIRSSSLLHDIKT